MAWSPSLVVLAASHSRSPRRRTLLCKFTITRSPFVMLSNGSGHCPLIPMTRRSACPSGFAVVQPMFQSYVTVSALAAGINPAGRSKSSVTRKFDKERAIAILRPWWKSAPSKLKRKHTQPTSDDDVSVQDSPSQRLIRSIQIRSAVHPLAAGSQTRHRISAARTRSDKPTRSTLQPSTTAQRLGGTLEVSLERKRLAKRCRQARSRAREGSCLPRRWSRRGSV